MHEQFPRVAAGVVHAGDDFRFQRVDLCEEVDGGHTAIKGLQVRGGVLRVLHVCPHVINAGAVMHRACDELREEADHLLQLGRLRANELRMLVGHALHDPLGNVEAAEVREREPPPLPHGRMHGMQAVVVHGSRRSRLVLRPAGQAGHPR